MNRGMMITISDPQTSIILMIMDSFVKSQGRPQEIISSTSFGDVSRQRMRSRKAEAFTCYFASLQTARYDHGIYARWVIQEIRSVNENKSVADYFKSKK